MPSLPRLSLRSWRATQQAATFLTTSKCGFALASLTVLIITSGAWAADPPADPGLRVAPGFKVSVFADEKLAADVYAMTLDAKGRVVITSRGWIKTLIDDDNDGKADRAVEFARTNSGGMGMCFDGNDLYFTGDGWLQIFRDQDGDGQADGMPERIIPLAFGEHGGHAPRKGPDGSWYVIGGNDARINAKDHVTLPGSPVQKPEGGGVLRLTPDLKKCEVIAHGFRNPYDFDFNAAGDLFTYDSDVEADFFLPWYSPTRVYHVQHGGHHGWRLEGWRRSWCRKDYYVDTTDILYPVGRGSPTGVACYRHDQFPEKYRGGLFVLDWTFGKVFFQTLEPDGAGYSTKVEVFIEPKGTSGFAPSDVAVGKDGALYLCIGGRGTRGTVYKIEYTGSDAKRAPAPKSDLDRVLRAHQPLDAWSRAEWEPLAHKLGAKPFSEAVLDEKRAVGERVRAVEVLTELFDGPWEIGNDGYTNLQVDKPEVQARIAWSIGRTRKDTLGWIVDRLVTMSLHPNAHVRRCALEGLAERVKELREYNGPPKMLQRQPPDIPKAIVSNLAHDDKRVRQAAARLAALVSDKNWDRIHELAKESWNQAKVSVALAELWRQPDAPQQHRAIDLALDVLEKTNDNDLRLQAIRLLMMAWGDYHLQNPPVEAYTAYSLSKGTPDGNRAARARKLTRAIFPQGDEIIDQEAARLLAMLEDDDAELVDRVTGRMTDMTTGTSDMHYLIVLSRLTGKRGEAIAPWVADTILNLDRKLAGQEQRNKQNWSLRLNETLAGLMKHDPRLADALLSHADFVQQGHVPIVQVLDARRRGQAARLFLDAAKKDADFPWTGALIDLLATLPADETRGLFRTQWNNFALRDALLPQLARNPEAADRDKFLTALDSLQPEVVRLAVETLDKLPRDAEAKNLAPVVKLLRRLLLEPKEVKLRGQVLALLNRQTGQAFDIKEPGGDALRAAYAPVFDWFDKSHPDLKQAVSGVNQDYASWSGRFATIAWDKGDEARGAKLFLERGCFNCHAGNSRLGPDLAGVAARFSRDDLFAAILDPNRDVAPPYRVTVFETQAGQVYSGLVAFESADGVILLTGAAQNVRIATGDIVSRVVSQRSLMPDGLLKDCKPEDLADLYRYVQTLKGQK